MQAFSVWHFSNEQSLNNSFRNTIIVPNSLDPDQVQADLGPHCL